MKPITFTNPHRKKHFDFFNAMDHPHFNLTANVNITALHSYAKKNELPLTPCIVYLLSRVANEIPEFRWRIHGKQVNEHETVRPSFTVPTAEADVFSFCTVAYDPFAPNFIQNAQDKMKEMNDSPSFEDDDKQDDYLFLSAIPWISFTGLQHAMHYHPVDSIPRITWGKFFEQDWKLMMPLNVQAHHALVDGRHIGAYFDLLGDMAAKPATFFT
jgi:chloramphenicol O-acetyltransferase type A